MLLIKFEKSPRVVNFPFIASYFLILTKLTFSSMILLNLDDNQICNNMKVNVTTDNMMFDVVLN